MRRGLVALIAPFLLLAGAGCSAPTLDPPASAPAPTPSVVTVTPTPTATPTPVDDALCTDHVGDVRLLSQNYVLVDASRGASDHKKMVKNFYDSANELSKDVSDDCESGIKTVAAAQVALDAATLNVGMVISGHVSKDDYAKTVRDGQTLFDAFDITDSKFGDDLFDK